MRHDPLDVGFVTSRSETDWLISILGEIDIRTDSLRTFADLQYALRAGRKFDAVLTDETVDDGTSYKDVIRECQYCEACPSVVVCLRNPTPQSIHAVFECGATDCLIPPYIHTEVRRTLEVAAARTMMGI